MGKGNSFLKGAVILGVAGIIVKIMGAFFRIPLANLIGDEGMGYYQSAYPIYLLLLVISTSGFPTAIAKIVSEKTALGDRYGAYRVFKVSFIALFFVGIITSSVLFFGARLISDVVIKNPKSYYSMKAIAPALFFVPIMSAFRGYYQGLQDMKPTALSQIIEQFGRVVLGITLAYMLLDKGLEVAAAGATFGATAGAFVGAVMMTLLFFKNKGDTVGVLVKTHEVEEMGLIIKRLLAIAIPITIGAAVLPIMQSIDAAIVMRRLQDINYDAETANSLYGQLTGMANPLINLPQVVTAALQVSLVPAVSHLVTKRDRASLYATIESGTRMSLLIGLPAAIGLSILAEPIMVLLYPLQIESAISASRILVILGVGVIFLSLFQVQTGIIQGLGKPFVPVKNLFLGAVIKLIISYILLGIPEINVRGAALATVIGYGIASILNWIYIKNITGIKYSYLNLLVKPGLSVLVMAIIARYLYGLLFETMGNTIATLISVGVGAFIYLIMLIVTRTLTEEDYEIMPGGRRLSKIFRVGKRS